MGNEFPPSPYRLLVPFSTEDAGIFFGRERETTHLVAEILTNRIVVLFARTGAGKTSLLNAGVIPALKEKGFQTLYVRTGDDPLAELAGTLCDNLGLGNPTGVDPITTLIDYVKAGSKSFVLIMDQFEEFFNNVYARSLADAETFRERIAAAIDDNEIPLHFIFSLREEYFAKMIFFRDAIPHIFDAGFSVELSGLGQMEAEEAIRRPAENVGVHFAEPLVQRLISELGGPGGVETATLQIVCDTLFRQRAEPYSVTEADLDRSVLAGTVKLDPLVRANLNKAHEIIILRIAEGLAQGRSYEILDALRFLLEELSRPRERTKYTRPHDDLIIAVRAKLQNILRRKSEEELTYYAEEALSHLTHVGVVHDVSFGGTGMCELTHDYIPDNLVHMQPLLLALWPAFLVRDIDDNRNTDLTLEELNTIRDRRNLIQIDSATAATLLLSSVRLRHDGSFWFGCARSLGVDVKSLLPMAVQGKDLDALDTIEFLGDVHDVDSVRILMSFADSEYLFDEVQEALIAIVQSKKLPASSAAEKALVEFWTSREWSGEKSKGSFHKLLIAARDSRIPSLRKGVADLCRISIKKNGLASDLTSLLIERQVENGKQAEAIRTHLLGVDSSATDDQVLDPQFWRALVDLPSAKVKNVQVRAETAPSEALLSSAPNYEIIVSQLLRGAVIPFLGPGASMMQDGGACPPSASGLARRLVTVTARIGDSADIEDDQPIGLDLPRVASYFEHAVFDRELLHDELKAVFDSDFEPNVLHRLLARIAAKQPLLIITTNYDDMIERAFQEVKVPYDLVVTAIEDLQVKYQRAGESDMDAVDPQFFKIENNKSIIYKIFGGIDRTGRGNDSFVITEDDHITFLQGYLFPSIISGRTYNRRFLFLGCSFRDWYFRIILGKFLNTSKRPRSWAIEYRPNIIEKRLWERRGIQIIDMELLDFSNELMAHIDELRSAS